MKNVNFILLKQANVFAPEKLGINDILILNDKIVKVAAQISSEGLPNCKVINLNKLNVVPGIIDQHSHLIGGGGESGFYSQTPPAKLTEITTAGITTVIGLLGLDGISRSLESLFAKTHQLNSEGITAFMLTGSYSLPAATITGSIEKDIAFLDSVIGFKVAISDHRSASPSIAEIAKSVSAANTGGMIGNKAGVTVFHIGDSKRGLNILFDILDNFDIPITKMLPTHVSRKPWVLEDAIQYGKMGGYIDFTASPVPGVNPSSKGICQALDAGVSLNRITFSSDAVGSMPIFDDKNKIIGMTKGNYYSLLNLVRELVFKENWSISNAIQLITSNIADLWNFNDKGRIDAGKDADLLFLDDELKIVHLIGKGNFLIKDHQICKYGFFEK